MMIHCLDPEQMYLTNACKNSDSNFDVRACGFRCYINGSAIEQYE